MLVGLCRVWSVAPVVLLSWSRCRVWDCFGVVLLCRCVDSCRCGDIGVCVVVVWSQLRKRVKLNFIDGIGKLKALFIARELKALKQNTVAVRHYIRSNGAVARSVRSVTPVGRSRLPLRGSPKVRLDFPSRQLIMRSHGDMRSGSGGEYQ